ncbi:MAG: DUF4270 domain-containing protein [Bacteroidaceae bacterium]|nr:DUF4270 domain-containing protein [Bacteroidaceae bacterium]
MNISFARVMLVALTAMTLIACDNDTASLGIYDEADEISTSASTYNFTTRSIPLGAVAANSSKCYLGAVRDPETGTTVKAEFLAQFHTFENYAFPDKQLMVTDSEGEPICDSIELRLYFNSYYGLADNPMKVYVYELDTDNVVSESETYKTDLNLESYLPAGAQPLVKKVFTATDYTITDSERTSTSYTPNVRIKLPTSLGQRIMQQAYEHPDYFKDSYSFMRKVCAGFLFKLQSGEGTMLTLDVSALNLYFSFRDQEIDTIYSGLARFAATQEVIQSTRFIDDDLTGLITATKDSTFTYLKSPAGIATEITFPVDEIYEGHENDSISRAQVVLTRLNSSFSYTPFGIPQTILIVHKPLFDEFFTNREVADGRRSFTTSFDSSFNTYTFSNLAKLISYMHQQKESGRAAEGLSSEQWNAKYPDWNRAVITPVTTSSVTNSSGYSTLVSICNDLSLSSIRLKGGAEPQPIQIIYSRYK